MSQQPDRLINVRFVALVTVNLLANFGFTMVTTGISGYVVGRGLSLGVAGAVVGAMPLAALAARPFSGWLADRTDKRSLLLVALLLNAAAVVGYATVHTAVPILALRVVHGVAFSLITTVSLALVARLVPVAALGRGMGIFGVAQAVAMASGPAVGLTVGHAWGPAATFLVAGAAILAGAAPALRLPRTSVDRMPWTGLHMRDVVAREALFYAAVAVALGSLTGVETAFVPLYGARLGLGAVGWYFTASAAVLLVSRAASGRLLDGLGFGRVLIGGAFLLVGSMVVLAAAPRIPGGAVVALLTAAALKAVGVGALQPALQAVAVSSVEAQRRGAAASTYYVGMDVGQAGAPMVAGGVAQSAGYAAMFGLTALPIVLVAFAWPVVRRRRAVAGKVSEVRRELDGVAAGPAGARRSPE